MQLARLSSKSVSLIVILAIFDILMARYYFDVCELTLLYVFTGTSILGAFIESAYRPAEDLKCIQG